MKSLLRVLLTWCLLITSLPAFSQAGGADDPLIADTMKNVWIVAGVGAAGAVLGLSTLSFVDEPSEHLKNIVTGAAIGIIVGVGIVAYLQGTKSKEMYQYGYAPEIKDLNLKFDSAARNQWHQDNFTTHQSKSIPTFQFNTSF